jgi:hypothetical protein
MLGKTVEIEAKTAELASTIDHLVQTYGILRLNKYSSKSFSAN